MNTSTLVRNQKRKDLAIDFLVPLVPFMVVAWTVLHEGPGQGLGTVLIIGAGVVYAAIWITYCQRARRKNSHLITIICSYYTQGIYKRIDENRELLELLQRESPELLKRCPRINSWLRSQDDFLVRLAKEICGSTQHSASYPRPWPWKTTGKIYDMD